jgi:hypothetical protein
MTKQAHITSRPNHQVGDRVIGLCGKEWKIKVVWADLPADYPICRDCVDVAVKALDQADDVIQFARVRADVVTRMAERLHEELHPEDLLLDKIAEVDEAHHLLVETKAAEKALRVRAQMTCTCLWRDGEIYEVDEDCPIHDTASPDDEPNEVTDE